MFKLYNKARDGWFMVYDVYSTEDALMFLVFVEGEWRYLTCEEFTEDEC